MAAEFLIGVEQSAFAVFVRTSVWAYPLVNTLHIVGVAMLFGAIVPLDLRFLGAWRGVPPDPLVRALVPVSVAGLILATVSGAALFTVRASEYATEPVFLGKLALIALGAANALLLRRTEAWRWLGMRRSDGAEPAQTRSRLAVAACLSLFCWLGAIALGRLLGYL